MNHYINNRMKVLRHLLLLDCINKHKIQNGNVLINLLTFLLIKKFIPEAIKGGIN